MLYKYVLCDMRYALTRRVVLQVFLQKLKMKKKYTFTYFLRIILVYKFDLITFKQFSAFSRKQTFRAEYLPSQVYDIYV